MTIDDETKELYLRFQEAALQGILAANPGGSMHRQPADMTNHAALLGAHGVISHLQGLVKLEAMLVEYRRGLAPAQAQPYPPPPAYTVQLPAPIPPHAVASASAIPPPTQAAPPALATGTSSPDSRTGKFVNTELCPVCAGSRAEPSKNNDGQCPYFHFAPHGNVIPPRPPPQAPPVLPQG